MTYNTGNPVPSTNPRDLYDNAEIVDKWVNTDVAQVPDRLGVPRLSLYGMQQEFNETQEEQAEQFAAALSALGYAYLADYAAGVTFTTRTQYVVRDGTQYRVADSTNIPFTLTGVWATDEPQLVLIESTGSILSVLIASTGATRIGTAEGNNVQQALDIRLKAGVDLGSTDIDTLGATSSHGLYDQGVPASATLAMGYPLASVGGALLVSQGVNGSQQQYTTSDGRMFLRSLTGPFSVDGPWSPWSEVTLPKTGLAGQLLSATGVGLPPVWIAPPGARSTFSALKIVYPFAIAPVVVTANFVTVTNASGSSITLLNFNQSATPKQTTSTANGLDTGTWANSTWYNLFAIYNPSTEARALLWSASASAPVLPTGFTHFARLGVNYNAGSSNGFVEGVQLEKTFSAAFPGGARVLASGVTGTQSLTAPVYSALSLASLVPVSAKSYKMRYSAMGATGTIASLSTVSATPYAGASGIISGSPPMFCSYVVTASSGSVGADAVQNWECAYLTSTFYVAMSGSGGVIWVTGWEDIL